MNMKHDLDDVHYTKRQRKELFFSCSYCILSASVMIFILVKVKDLPHVMIMVGVAISLITSSTGVLYALSRLHRTDHKQLHDMLATLGANNRNDAEPADER
jgi:tetrahydromethanopterin S-methyltransferase subunit E